jgi:Arf-GAP with SH3 domain, ANK repeat and PH domain-containing protein
MVIRQISTASSSGAIPNPTQDTTINGLTFVFASNNKELDTLVTREFHSDPNLHKNSNVKLVGSEFTTGGSPSVQLEFSWKWRPPKQSEDKGGGWRNSCTFVEYDQRAHRLNTLATFAFWVRNTRPSTANLPSPQFDHLALPRIRVASSHSVQSVMSDSEGPSERDIPSPTPGMDIPQELILAPTPWQAVIDVSCARPGEDLSAVDDGPLFRATMKALEQKTGNMRARMKKVLKKAEAAKEAQVQCNEAMSQFMEALREASISNANAVQPALEHYFDKIARQIQVYEGQMGVNLQRLIIEPMSKLYTLDIKQAESKKREFEDESKEYYNYVGRYLGQRQDSLKEKKRVESDSKYQSKRRTFELKRFDYSSFMQDLHGGRKEQEVLSHLTKFADSQTKSYLATARRIEEMLPQLDALVREVGDADKEYKIQRTEREEKRRNLEKNAKSPLETDAPPLPSISSISGSTTMYAGTSDTEMSRADSTGRGTLHHSSSTASQASVATATGTNGLTPSTSVRSSGGSPMSSPGQERFKGIRDLEDKAPLLVTALPEQIGGSQRKEGLLWAMSRPNSHVDPRALNKISWHK